MYLFPSAVESKRRYVSVYVVIYVYVCVWCVCVFACGVRCVCACVQAGMHACVLAVNVVEAYMHISVSLYSLLHTATFPPVSPASSEPVLGAAMSPSPMDTAPVNSRGI